MSWKRRLRNIALGGVAALFIAGGIGRRTPTLEVQNSIDPTVDVEITVMTANVARGEGDDAKIFDIVGELLRLSKKPTEAFDMLDDLIQKEQVDIACFQEIEYTIQGTHQPRDRAEHTSLHNYAFGPNFVHEFFGLYYFADGNAVISRYPLYNSSRESLDTHKAFSLSAVSEFFGGSKSILSTKIKYHGQDITLICTHLSNWDTEFSSEKERDAELEAVFQYAAQHTPTIILGDLNTVPLSAQKQKYDDKDYSDERGWDRVKKMLDEHENLELQYDPRLGLFSRTATPAFPGTYNGVVPQGMLGKPNTFPDSGKVNDYILVLNNKNDSLQLELYSTTVMNDRFYSDHLPVIGKIMVQEKSRKILGKRLPQP